jgi:hypothetical protein
LSCGNELTLQLHDIQLTRKSGNLAISQPLGLSVAGGTSSTVRFTDGISA